MILIKTRLNRVERGKGEFELVWLEPALDELPSSRVSTYNIGVEHSKHNEYNK